MSWLTWNIIEKPNLFNHTNAVELNTVVMITGNFDD